MVDMIELCRAGSSSSDSLSRANVETSTHDEQQNVTAQLLLVTGQQMRVIMDAQPLKCFLNTQKDSSTACGRRAGRQGQGDGEGVKGCGS